MRENLFKVSVERPRSGGGMPSRERRLYRAGEDISLKIGMKQGWVTRKWRSEHLSSLQRWLEFQAIRPRKTRRDETPNEIFANQFVPLIQSGGIALVS